MQIDTQVPPDDPVEVEHCDLCTRPVPWSLLEHRLLDEPRWIRPTRAESGEILCTECQAAREATAVEARVAKRLKAWGVPKRFRDYRWSRVLKQQRGEAFAMFHARIEGQPDPTIGITHRNARCAAALRDWRPRRGGRWILVSGTTGTGKTTFASATVAELAGDEPRFEQVSLNELYEIDAARARQYDPAAGGRFGALPVRRLGGHTATFVQEHDLQQTARDWYRRSRQGSKEDDPMSAVASCSCLVLDDLGTAEQSDNWRSKIAGLLDRRYAAELPTVITSNDNRTQLELTYGARFGSRMHEIADYYELDLADWRRR